MIKRAALALFLLAFAASAVFAAPPQARPADLAVSFQTTWPGLFVGAVADVEREQRWLRLQRFLGGVETERFRMRPGAVNAYVMTSDAEGDATWQPVSAVVGTVNDDPFIVQDDADATKKMRFETSSITAGATRVLTIPNVSSTIAVLDTGQAFTRPQTFSAATGTALTVSPSAGHGLVLTPPSGFYGNMVRSVYTDNNFTLSSATNDQIWDIEPTVSAPGDGWDCDDFSYIRFKPTFGNIFNAGFGQSHIAFDINSSFALSATSVVTSNSFAGLRFQVTHNSTGGLGLTQGALLGIQGSSTQASTTDDINSIAGGSFRTTVNNGCSVTIGSNPNVTGVATPMTIAGTATTAQNINALAPTGAGTITTWRGYNVQAFTSGPTTSTATGLNMGNITKGITSRQMVIGTSSSAAPSIIWSKTAFGGSTAPTAIVDIQGTGATAPAERWAAAAQPTSPGEGDQWNESTRNATGRYVNGVVEYIPGVIYTDTSTTKVTNTTTETDLVGTGIGTVTLPANFFSVGKMLRVTIRGRWEVGNAAADTVRLRLYYGGTSGTILYDSDRQNPAVTTNGNWEFNAVITCRATGASGIVSPYGIVLAYPSSGPNTSVGPYRWPNASIVNSTNPVTINTTTANAIAFSVKWGQSSTSDIWTRTQMVLEALN